MHVLPQRAVLFLVFIINLTHPGELEVKPVGGSPAHRGAGGGGVEV